MRMIGESLLERGCSRKEEKHKREKKNEIDDKGNGGVISHRLSLRQCVTSANDISIAQPKRC